MCNFLHSLILLESQPRFQGFSLRNSPLLISKGNALGTRLLESVWLGFLGKSKISRKNKFLSIFVWKSNELDKREVCHCKGPNGFYCLNFELKSNFWKSF